MKEPGISNPFNTVRAASSWWFPLLPLVARVNLAWLRMQSKQKDKWSARCFIRTVPLRVGLSSGLLQFCRVGGAWDFSSHLSRPQVGTPLDGWNDDRIVMNLSWSCMIHPRFEEFWRLQRFEKLGFRTFRWISNDFNIFIYLLRFKLSFTMVRSGTSVTGTSATGAGAGGGTGWLGGAERAATGDVGAGGGACLGHKINPGNKQQQKWWHSLHMFTSCMTMPLKHWRSLLCSIWWSGPTGVQCNSA